MKKLISGILVSILFLFGCQNESVETPTKKELRAIESQIIQKNQVLQMVNAAQSGNYQKVDELLKKGVDVNGPGKYELPTSRGIRGYNNALEAACYGGHYDIAKLLVSKGADVNFSSIFGKTPLYSAVYGGNIDIVKLLLDNGAKVNLGESALLAALKQNQTEIAALLIDKGANVNYMEESGLSPLKEAVRIGSIEIVKKLLDNNAIINDKRAEFGNHAHTPLWVAVSMGHTNIVKLLLDEGADINIADNASGTTPLDIAMELESEAIVGGRKETFKEIIAMLKDSKTSN